MLFVNMILYIKPQPELQILTRRRSECVVIASLKRSGASVVRRVVKGERGKKTKTNLISERFMLIPGLTVEEMMELCDAVMQPTTP